MNILKNTTNFFKVILCKLCKHRTILEFKSMEDIPDLEEINLYCPRCNKKRLHFWDNN